MTWEDLSITKPHLVYILLGAFTSLFMLCSSFIKERLYIGEATIATIFGVIFGPHCANLINPLSWGSVDIITIEFSRIVLVVQCFAVGVELPKYYMEKHWRSVVILLLPIMTWGWLVTSLFIWWLIKPLNWLESLVVSACVTATDPVLASSVVGKGKFARRVPKHLRDLLSAESGCNDGMAFPFLYLGVWLILEHKEAGPVTFHWFVLTILYGCIFGAFFGFMVGFIGRHGIRQAEKWDLIDRESFLVFYFVLALFCAGSGSMLGLDDLLVGFAAGVGFSNDGWFHQKTEESHVSNVIDLLLNLTYFVYLGTIIPWEQYNDASIGLSAWRLVVIAILVILFRRIPIMLMMKPFIPDIKTWREALFAGHFGPIGVGAIFVAMLARAEMEHGETVPDSELPEPGSPHYNLIILVWPIVTFLVISSIIVHGSSIAVFTLGKRINTLSLTMSYTQAVDDGSGWVSRLPRILSTSKSQARTVDSDTDAEISGMVANMQPGSFLRRRRSEDAGGGGNRSRTSSLRPRRRKKKSVGGHIEQSAIYPQRPEAQDPVVSDIVEGANGEASSTAASNENVVIDAQVLQNLQLPKLGRTRNQMLLSFLPPRRRSESINSEKARKSRKSEESQKINVYDEGDHLIFENEDGDVLGVVPTNDSSSSQANKKSPVPDPEKGELPLPVTAPAAPTAPKSTEGHGWSFRGIKNRISSIIQAESQKRKECDPSVTALRSANARVFQFGNTVLIEDDDGNVLKLYEFESEKAAGSANPTALLKLVGLGNGSSDGNRGEGSSTGVAGSSGAPPAPGAGPTRRRTFLHGPAEPEIDDRHIRFTLDGKGKRMTKEDFINEMRKLDSSTRSAVINSSSASEGIRALATMERQGSMAAVPGTVIKKQPVRDQRSRRTKEAKSSSRPTSSADKGKDTQVGASAAGALANDESGSESDDGLRPSRSRLRESEREDMTKSVEDMLSPLAPTGTLVGKARADDADDDEDNQETEAEKRRRLAVLGTIEDDTPRHARSEVATPTVTTPVATGGNDYFSLAMGQTTSGMNTPGGEDTPARSRGIRFAPESARRR